MNKELGLGIHSSNLLPNQKYILKMRSGAAVVKTLENLMHGWCVEIIEGAFRPLGKPRLTKGDVFTVSDGNGQFYEIA